MTQREATAVKDYLEAAVEDYVETDVKAAVDAIV